MLMEASSVIPEAKGTNAAFNFLFKEDVCFHKAFFT